MTSGSVISLTKTLRPQAVLLRGEIAHRYLENRILRLSEATFASVLDEQPEIGTEMSRLLADMTSTFIIAYDPTPFVTHLAALRSLEAETRHRLIEVLQAEFAARFRPVERLAALREGGQAFLDAFQAWHSEIRRNGVTSVSAPLWNVLRERSGELLALLGDPELRTRWIP